MEKRQKEVCENRGFCVHSPEAAGLVISNKTVPDSMSRILNLVKSIL